MNTYNCIHKHCTYNRFKYNVRNVCFLADIDIHADLGICFMDAICTVAKEAPHNGRYEVVSKSDCFDSEGRAWGYYGDKTTCDSQEYLGKFSSEAVGKKRLQLYSQNHQCQGSWPFHGSCHCDIN